MRYEEEGTGKTWFVDLDGTVLEHQSNDSLDAMMDNYPDIAHTFEKALPGVVEFFQSLPKRDKIIITTARLNSHIDHTLKVLNEIGMPYDEYIFEVQSGPRVVVNDIKPKYTCGNERPLDTAYAINVMRDVGTDLPYKAKSIEENIQTQINGTNNSKELLNENNGTFC